MSNDQTKKFIRLAEAVKDITERSDMSWRQKYLNVFSGFKGELDATGIKVDWSDPDTTYEEDVMAYVNAVVKKAEELEAEYPKVTKAHAQAIKETIELNPGLKLSYYYRELIQDNIQGGRWVVLVDGNESYSGDFELAFKIFMGVEL